MNLKQALASGKLKQFAKERENKDPLAQGRIAKSTNARVSRSDPALPIHDLLRIARAHGNDHEYRSIIGSSYASSHLLTNSLELSAIDRYGAPTTE